MFKTKKNYFEVCLLLIVLFLIAATFKFPAENIRKRYSPNPEAPYWFETKNDLLFSEELHLPDYNEKELGKLEYPSLAIDSRKNVFVAYDFTSENGKEAIFINSFQDADLPLAEIVQNSAPTHFLKFKQQPEWQSPLQVSADSGSEYRPRLAVTPDDVVWIVWSAKRQGQWDIYARTFSGGKLGREIQVTTKPVYDFRPVVLADASGKVWIAWERGSKEKNMQIVVKYVQHGVWSDEFILENRPGYAYRPALLGAPDGAVWLAWDDHDPEIQTNYEIVSIHGANEYAGNLPIPHRGGLPGTFAQDGLALGKRFGFVGASDSHGLYFHSNEGWREDAYKGGLTGVLLSDTLSRENVWQALQARRNYATTGEKYYLEFSINRAPMGSEINISEPPVIAFEVRGSELLYAYILRDNEQLFVSGKIGGNYTAYKNMKDTTVQPGSHFYYLRAVYTDGSVAWTSPIWVNYLNEEETK